VSRTISYLNADLARAKQQGARVMEVSLADMAELLAAAESGFAMLRSERPMKHAGWMKPGSISMMRSGRKRYSTISRRRSDEFNTELFFADNLQEKQREVDAALDAAKAAQPGNATVEVKTMDLSGKALDWSRKQPDSDQPKTYGCHHNMPVCDSCDWLVRRWLVTELGETVNVPKELMQ